jgi:hypothetical protein
MRIKSLLVLSALAAATLPAMMPAAAQGAQVRSCVAAKRDNSVGGAILGGLIGGVLGSNVAASGHRHDGTAVGAVLGGMIGAGVGRDTTNCVPETYRPGYGQQGYGPGSAYDPNPAYGGPNYDRGYPEPYDDHDYGYDRGPRDLYPSNDRSYDDDGFAGSDCEQAMQVTRLPDGREIHRPIEVCRDAYYGDWRIRD